MEPALRADINGHSQQILQILLQTHHIQQAAVWLPLHEKVQVARVRSLPPCHGTVHADAPCPVPAGQIEDRRALLPPQIIQGHHMYLYSRIVG